MQGVRRWMGASHGSSKRKANAATPLPKAQPSEGPQIQLDPHSVEGIVARLLSPTVPEQEENEYRRQVPQLRFLQYHVVNHITLADTLSNTTS